MAKLAQLKAQRTRASNTVQRLITHMLTEDIEWTLGGRVAMLPDDRFALPSWWPFWSDCLKTHVRGCVQAARALARAEGMEL